MESATSLPRGTVTFLFTDIEGSAKLWEEHPEAMAVALARHDALLRHTISAHGGFVFKSMGDQFCAAFATAREALAAALTAQRALGSEPWGGVGPVRVRMALHTGAAEQRDGDYFGPPLNRVARLLAAGHGGQILLSQATCDLVREALSGEANFRDLGAHRLKDLQQPERVFQLLSQDLPSDFPPLRSLEAFAHNLPAQLTSFIGREREMAAVKQLLTTTRLLTLTGSGGCGKTRLALQVGADLVEEYADGVWLVELAPLAAPTSGGYPALVPQAVASTLGVREEPGRPLTATLTEYLRRKALLLVLDNCEHLLAACAELAESLLRGCPQLRILASSREGLNIPGETPYRLRSLSSPDPEHLPALDGLTHYEAVQLFVDRAATAALSFTLTPTNAPAVARICERVDGIPLAIELAAARVKALPVETISERLADRFRLLTGGSRTALPRHRTLRALVDWSYDLLSEAERTLLRRLSLFAGGWTLEAAEAVCGEEGVGPWALGLGTDESTPGLQRPTPNTQGLRPGDVLDLLTSLVEKSLVQYEEGKPRYWLLETIRQYSRERLVRVEELAAVARRHWDWCLALAEEAEPHLTGREQTLWLQRLDVEHDNLRVALEWSLAAGAPAREGPEAEAGLRLAGALWRFWMVRGYAREGQGWLGQALAQGGGAPAAVRAKAFTGAGSMAFQQGEFAQATALHEQALALYREAGDQSGVAFALNNLGCQSLHQGEYEGARALFEESLALARDARERWLIACALQNLGALFQDRGEYERAALLHEESLTFARELGDDDLMVLALVNLGEIATAQGDLARAESFLRQSLSLAREHGYKRALACSLNYLGLVKQELEDYAQAQALHREGLALLQEVGDRWGIAECLEGLAGAACAQEQPGRGTRLYGAAEGLRAAIHAPLEAPQRARHDRHVAVARTALGEEAFAAAWAEGRAMPMEQAIKYALES